MGTTTPAPDPVPVPPAVAPVRPGDLILIRAISWWDSGALKRIIAGILGSAGPVIYDMIGKDALTWRTLLNAILFGIFVYMGFTRSKAPEMATGFPALDKAGTAARVDAQALALIQRSTPAIVVPNTK